MCVCVCVRVTDVYTMCFGEFPDICNRCERNKEIAQNAQRQDVEIGGGILQHCARVVQNHRVALTFGFASCSFDFSAWHYWAGRFRLGCACRFTCGRQQPLHIYIYIYYIIILYIYIYTYVSCCLLLAGLQKKRLPMKLNSTRISSKECKDNKQRYKAGSRGTCAVPAGRDCFGDFGGSVPAQQPVRATHSIKIWHCLASPSDFNSQQQGLLGFNL